MMHRIEYASLERTRRLSWVAQVGIVVINIINPEYNWVLDQIAKGMK